MKNVKHKNTLWQIIVALLICGSAALPLDAATVTGRSADSSLAGTEKIPADSSGVDTYILVSTLWNAMTLTGGVTASGSSAFDFSGSTGAFKTSTGVNTFGGSSNLFAAGITPAVSDVGALGSATLNWSDLFLASGGVINWNNGDVLVTHSSGVITVAGSGAGDLRVTTAGTNAASVVTVGGTQTLTSKTLTSPVIGTGLTASGSAANTFAGSTGTFITSTGANTFKGSSHGFDAKLFPSTDDGAALGDTTHHFSDLFLATGAVLNFQNGNVAVTHSSGILTMGTGELRITTAGTNAASVITVGSTSTLTNKTLTSPVIGSGLTASGSGANTFAGSTGTFITSTGANTFKGSAHNFDAVLQPTTDDVAALGTTLLGFSDLFLASGATVNFAATDVVLTHSTGILTMGTGELRITTAGTNAASVITVGSTSTLTNKTLTTPTLTTPVISTGLSASGSAANTFGGSTGTFVTSSGANTLSGDVSVAAGKDIVYAAGDGVFDASLGTGIFKSNTGANTLGGAVLVNDATTPSVTLASGKTNTGFFLVNGKTSGSFKIITADATGQAVTLTVAAQTSGAGALGINDLGGVAHSLMVSTLTSNTTGALNSVTGASNALVYEGTADASETSIAAADATADTTLTFPAKTASGFIEVLSVEAEAVTDTITAGQLYGSVITNTGSSGAAVLTLPAPVVGMHFRVYLTVAQDVDINPADGTQILGLTNATGDAISSASAIGNCVELIALSTTTWAAFAISGTWSDAN
jgi:hypothetical protein